MKAMKNSTGLKALTYFAMGFFMFLSSCKDSNTIDFTATDAVNVESEATTEAYSADALDISTDAISGISDAQLNGREATTEPVTSLSTNDKLKCATITINRTGTTNAPAGVITIVFPNDGTCKDVRGISRRGTITITYSGRRFVPGSVITTTFSDYYIGAVKIEGVHTLTNVTPVGTNLYPRFNIVITGGKATFLDGSTVTREQNFTREWQRQADPTQDKWVLFAGGSAAGSNRKGKVYTMNITKDLVYSRACQISDRVFIAVAGEKTFISETKSLTINYGDGACDNTVTITINGKSKDVTVKGDGN
jgi:hypothetical protein